MQFSTCVTLIPWLRFAGTSCQGTVHGPEPRWSASAALSEGRRCSARGPQVRASRRGGVQGECKCVLAVCFMTRLAGCWATQARGQVAAACRRTPLSSGHKTARACISCTPSRRSSNRSSTSLLGDLPFFRKELIHLVQVCCGGAAMSTRLLWTGCVTRAHRTSGAPATAEQGKRASAHASLAARVEHSERRQSSSSRACTAATHYPFLNHLPRRNEALPRLLFAVGHDAGVPPGGETPTPATPAGRDQWPRATRKGAPQATSLARKALPRAGLAFASLPPQTEEACSGQACCDL